MKRFYEKPEIIVIVGPTASGKSDLAVRLAQKLNGEIVSADSRQVYKGLDIGTGKVTKKEMGGIKHYLLDVADPKKTFSVTDFVRLAKKAIEEICKKGKVPIVCGGTGFYIQALVDGIAIPEVAPNKKLREKLEKLETKEILAILKRLDPARYRKIDRNNRRRIIRSVEIASAIGKVPALKKISLFKPTFIGIHFPPDLLKKRIHDRLKKRLRSGMISEIKRLHRQGLSWKRMEDLGLEYRFIARHLQNEISRIEMETQLETAISQYAKRQMTWFKRDKRIAWIEGAR